jgi:hypothetical protein
MKLENHYYSFDPKDIDFSVKQFSLYQVLRRLQHGEICLDTYFQRRSDLWDQVKQSRFIESILIRIPIPAFYFAEVDYDKWQVIDGLQRITTLKNFIAGRLKLTGLEFLPEFGSHTVETLPIELVRRIEDSSITAFIIKHNTQGRRINN